MRPRPSRRRLRRPHKYCSHDKHQLEPCRIIVGYSPLQTPIAIFPSMAVDYLDNPKTCPSPTSKNLPRTTTHFPQAYCTLTSSTNANLPPLVFGDSCEPSSDGSFYDAWLLLSSAGRAEYF